MRRRVLVTVGIALLVVLAGCSSSGGGGAGGGVGDGGGGAVGGDGGSGAASGDSVGLSAGGAQDATAFRRNVREGYVPRPRGITHAGLYHDYYFDTGQSRECSAMFCPSYSKAVSRDPLSNETEYFMTVGLNSGLSQADFERPDLNVVVVLDTSGSMDEQFDQYYYEGGERHTVAENAAKMDAAADAVATLTRHLDEGDRFGLVTFSDSARTVQELRAVGETDMDDLRRRVQRVRPGGGTDLEAGMDRARRMVAEYAEPNSSTETRIIYVTDAMPNQGETGTGALRNQLGSDADQGIHTTFVGVGVDFNTELVDAITGIRGANYYTVSSPAQFSERMGEGFDYMVSPLVYDLSLELASDAYRIEDVYGTPSEGDTGRLMHVTTLFPSRREGNRTEGGVILLELARTDEGSGGGTLQLTASYDTRTGDHRETTRTVGFDAHEPPYYDNTGVRKAVALTRYATLLQNWMHYEHARAAGEDPGDPPEGIEGVDVDRWEESGVPLQVSPPYTGRMRTFRSYFAGELEAIGDESMRRELELLDRIVASAEPADREAAAADSEAAGTDPVDDEPTDTGDDTSASLRLFGWSLPPLDALSLFATVALGLYGARRHKQHKRGR